MVPHLNPIASRLPAGSGRLPTAGVLTDRVCKRLAFGLVFASVVFHLAYLAFDCPLDLSPDEAHYWQWSRHLAWSYYSKGPLVAWLIRASCELFGPLSESLVGSPMLAVRVPAVACHAVLLAGWYVLTASTLKSHRAALAVVLIALSFPVVAAGAVLMTIDPPFLACWCWATVGVWKGLGARSAERGVQSEEGEAAGGSGVPRSALRASSGGLGWWVLAGVCSAFGVLAKYPMVMLPVCVFGYLLFNKRESLKKPGFWVFVLGSVVGVVPIVAWNYANDWVSFKHVGTQAAGSEGSSIRWFGPFIFAGGQVAFLIGVWFAMWVAAVWSYRRATDPAHAFLWWASVPVWGLFAAASLKASGQLNWPAAAYVTGFVLTVAWARDQLSGPYRKIVLRFVITGVAIGLTISIVVHYPALVRPALASVAGPVSEQDRAPIRKFDPTARLRGWRFLGEQVDAVRARVRAETGEEPIVAGTGWNVPGVLGAYCKGHPETYSLGSALGDRHSQYDIWRPNPVADAQVFRGRTFVVVGGWPPAEAEVFERMEPPIVVTHREEGVPVAVWWIWVGVGYKDFSKLPSAPGRW